MTNNDKVKTIFSLLGEVIADVIFPVGAEIDTTEQTVSDAEPGPTEEPEPADELDEDPNQWFSVGQLMRLDCCMKHAHNDELRELSRQEFADYRRDPASHFPEPAQINGRRKYWQMYQIDEWIDDPDKLSIDTFIARRRVGVGV